MKKKILSLSGPVLFEYECETAKELVEAAVKFGANLSGANLSGADLYGANLYGADLYGADLSRANLSRANLSGANLSGANLSGANLTRADLSGANLSGANLYGADLYGANLYGANLYGADLSRANLSRAKNAELVIAQTRILPEGDIIGYKKCREDVIVKLLIPKEAKRSHAFGRKCRAEYAQVLEIFGSTLAVSKEDASFAYKVGDTVKPVEPFNEKWQEECASGIHFFITKIEAENY